MRIVITGASSGIGAALARYYASEDSVLGLIARRPGNQTLKGKVTHYLVDVTDESALAAAAETSLRASGAPDLVIANAGVSTGTSGEDIADIAKLKHLLNVNVAGLAATLAAFAPAMRQAGRGTLAGIASVAGFRGLAGNGAYSGSKAAARIWMESLRASSTAPGVRGLHLPGLHRYADDPRQPLSHAVPAFRRRSGAAHRARHRGAAPAGGHSVADGARLGAAARDAWLAVRPVRGARAAQAARRGYLTLAGIPTRQWFGRFGVYVTAVAMPAA